MRTRSAKKKKTRRPACDARSPRKNAAPRARSEDRVRLYVEHAKPTSALFTVEKKVASELVGPVRHTIWDVHCQASRLVGGDAARQISTARRTSRVGTSMLTFHLGLALRLMYASDREVPVRPEAAHLLPGSWRRWQQAFEAYDSGDEAEAFQSVGVRLRECLVSFIAETRHDDLVPKGEDVPKAADFRAWSDLLANFLAPGDGSAKLRSYLKKDAAETWEYVNWLTHAKNAVRMDAEIGLKAVEHLLGVFTAARLRHDVSGTRCAACGSYRVVGGVCEHCDWRDPDYRSPQVRHVSKAERAAARATPCVPSSDISTLMSPKDFEKSRIPPDVLRPIGRRSRSTP